MSIELKRVAGWIIAAAWVMAVAGPLRLGAVTVEVDENEKPAAHAPAAAPATPSAEIAESKTARVRISEKIGFYYFMKAGFIVPDDSKVSSVGKVLGSSKDDMEWYQLGDKTYVELSPKQSEVKKGDLLVVYRTDHHLAESHSGFSGWWIRNLAVVKVLGVEKRRCEVLVKKSFYPYKIGDKVRLYDDEISRWKQAQVKKPLPDHPLNCYVVTTEANDGLASQADSVVLTAGSKQGVVEGQRFQLRDTVYPNAEPIRVNRGLAQVFYVGTHSSMAQILFSHDAVKRGFEASYLP